MSTGTARGGERLKPSEIHERLTECLAKASRWNPDSPHRKELRELFSRPEVLDYLEEHLK